MRRQKDAVEALRREKEELEKETASHKALLIEEKKASARIAAKLAETVNEVARLEAQAGSTQEIQQKMALKDE